MVCLDVVKSASLALKGGGCRKADGGIVDKNLVIINPSVFCFAKSSSLYAREPYFLSNFEIIQGFPSRGSLLDRRKFRNATHQKRAVPAVKCCLGQIRSTGGRECRARAQTFAARCPAGSKILLRREIHKQQACLLFLYSCLKIRISYQALNF